MARVIHFELGVDDVQRAIDFYSRTFGWKIEKWDGPTEYWLVSTGDAQEPGIDGAIFPRQGGMVWNNVIGVENLDEALQKLVENGGKVLEGKMTIPGVGYFAQVTDTEGNGFGLMQDDPGAK